MKKKKVNVNYVSSENYYSSPSNICIVASVILIFYSLSVSSTFPTVFIIIIIAISVIVCSVAKSIWNSKINGFKDERDKMVKKLEKKCSLSYEALTLDGKGICIDEENKTVYILNAVNKSVTHYDFKKIMSFELRENGNPQIEGKGMSTYLAGKYVGQNAAMAVASSSRDINEFCTELIISIHIEGINAEDVNIELIKNARVNKNSISYKEIYNFAKDIVVTLDKVMNVDKKKDNVLENKDSNKDDLNQLKKLKELLDEGILTKEEFEVKKKEYLGL